MTPGPELHSTRIKKLAIAGVLVVLAAVAFFFVGRHYHWWKAPPFGRETRVPWTTSKVIGSPEPGDPFIAERVFPNLKFSKPVDIVFAPSGNRIVVAQQDGQIVSFRNDNASARADLLVDLTRIATIKKTADYSGVEVFAVAFDPFYGDNHYCYISYRILFPAKRAADYKKRYPQNETACRVSRFKVISSDPPAIDPASETVIIAWPGGENSGGCIRFGQDSDLYISTGDGGDSAAPDPFEVAQDLNDLRGKILRIEVGSASEILPYGIPADNPFLNSVSLRGEIFAYGLRNPARFSFDSRTGDVWVGDQGWDLWESIHHVVKSANFGWSIREGPQGVYPDRKRGPDPILPPALALPRSEAGAIIGGVVYHGQRLPGLQGHYIFGDSETRRLWAAPCDGVKLGKYHEIAQTQLRIAAFGQDAGGEFYIVDNEGGGIWRLAKNPGAGAVPSFPRKLSETGLFADVAKQEPNPGVLPFTIIAPQWMDGASSDRFVAVPGLENVNDNDQGKRVFPANTVLVRTLSLPKVEGDAATRRKIETQLLHFDGQWWHGYSYQWNDDETDATLVDANGRDVELPIIDPAAPGGKRKQTWHFNGRTQCMTCHAKSTGYVIAFSELQLDRTEQFETAKRGVVADNQLRSFRHIGLMPPAKPPAPAASGTHPPAPAILVNPYDEDSKVSLDDRARAYLHINCSICHRKGGGGAATFDLRREMTFHETNLVSNPVLGTFNLPDSQLVCPGDPSRSVLYYRMAMTGHGRMPPGSTTLIDDRGLELIAKWIVSLQGRPGGTHLSEQTRQAQDAQSKALKNLQSGASGAPATAAVDQLVKTPDGALRLLTALQDGRIAQSLRPLAVERAMQSPASESVRDLFMRFAPQGTRAVPRVGARPDADKIKAILALPSDAARGRKVFFEFGGGLCARCHMIAREGAQVGPDLSQIGAKLKKPEILAKILDPSKSITPRYETYLLRTKKGEVFLGFLESKSSFETVLRDTQGKLIHVRAEKIDTLVQDSRSAMPDGLILDLELQQAGDLLEFLATRSSAPGPP